MTTVNRQHLAGLLAYKELCANGGYRNFTWAEILDSLIAQASAAPEQEPIAEFGRDCIFNLRKQPNGERWPVGTKLYTHADPSGSFAKHMECMELCRQQQKTIDGMNAAHWEVVQKLEAATQRADAAERKLVNQRDFVMALEAFEADGETFVRRYDVLDALLSASAEPGDVETPDLYRFLDAAAGEGLICDGVDAGDLFISLYPNSYAAAKGGDGEVQS